MTVPEAPALPDGLRPGPDWRRTGGGCICTVLVGSLADGRPVVVKQTPYPAEVEAHGLRLLREAGAPVPRVLGCDAHTLVLEHVTGHGDWGALGERLAELHRTGTQTRFGLDRDNRIGSLVQPNVWDDDWPSFYARCRIRPHLDAPALPTRTRRRIERGLDGPLADLLPARPPASLIHGDLWSGNVIDAQWLIDPAVAYADREFELAFMEVFGGFPQELYAAYDATWPLAPGFAERRPALQLSHLLVHVRLFGGAYVGAVEGRLDQLGW